VNLSRHLDLDDIVLDGVHNQITYGVQAELSHDVAAMSFHGLRTQVQQRSNFFGTLALRKKLSDFPLPHCQGG
jgi:hypothetical protein